MILIQSEILFMLMINMINIDSNSTILYVLYIIIPNAFNQSLRFFYWRKMECLKNKNDKL